MLDHVGRECKVSALNQEWTFSRWDRGVWVAFAEWAKSVLPDPVEAATRSIDKIVLRDAEIIRELRRRDDKEMIDATAAGRKPILLADNYRQMSDLLVEKALDKGASYLSFNSPELSSLMRSAIGTSYWMWLLLKTKHPELTVDDTYEIFVALGQQAGEIDRIIKTTQGQSEAKPKNE